MPTPAPSITIVMQHDSVQAWSAVAIAVLTAALVWATFSYARAASRATALAYRTPSIEAARRMLGASNHIGVLILPDGRVRRAVQFSDRVGDWWTAYADTFGLIRDDELTDRLLAVSMIVRASERKSADPAVVLQKLRAAVTAISGDLGAHVANEELPSRQVPSNARVAAYIAADADADVSSYL